MSIPLHLVTGFLGSGKTTFLSRFLKSFDSSIRIAVVQNEFAPINIDTAVLKVEESYNVLEVNNGSVFCVCLLGSFIDSLLDFIKRYNPDVIVMEASGLSDTLGVGQMFQSSKLKSIVYLEHIWCIVDAVNYQRSIKQRFDHQVRSADTIILNKTDLCHEDLSSIQNSLKAINPYAKIHPTSYAQIEFGNSTKPPKFFQIGNTQPLGRPTVESVVIKAAQKISKENLSIFLKKHAAQCYRYKGFIQTDEGQSLLVQGIFENFTFEIIPNYIGPCELVLIGNIQSDENLQITYQHYCQ